MRLVFFLRRRIAQKTASISTEWRDNGIKYVNLIWEEVKKSNHENHKKHESDAHTNIHMMCKDDF